MNDRLAAIVSAVAPRAREFESAARTHLDDLTKPRGSMGRLEDAAASLFCMNGGKRIEIDPVRLFTVAGDHGVVAEGVSAYPAEVTRQMVMNFLAGGAAINVLCRTFGIDLRVVDAGCAGEPFAPHPLLIRRRIAPGTANMAVGPAMRQGEAESALLAGIELARESVSEGIRCLAVGEMGIGNTTAASALFAAWLACDPETLVGPGTGLDRTGIRRKTEVIRRALNVNKEALDSNDALRILAAFGGFEIAMMAGIIIGAAEARTPCLVDGFISQAAWLSAIKLCPPARDFTFIAHTSAEPGSPAILALLGETPLLSLGMRLGEGTGAALAVPLLRGAAAIFNDMATFSGAGVSDAHEGDAFSARQAEV